MESEVALLTVHDSVDDTPTATDAGLPLKLEITGAGMTVTVAVAVTVPPSPIAVKVYVVVTEGVTTVDVPVTEPTPLSMDSEVVLLTFQESVEELPIPIVAGLAPKLAIAGAGARIVTVVEDVAIPPPFVAMSRYVVVSVGCTTTEFPVTTPTPGSMEIEVAFVTDQRSVVDCPGETVDASAVNELITGAGVFCVKPAPFVEHAASTISVALKTRRVFMAFLPALRRARRSRSRRWSWWHPSGCRLPCSRRRRWW